VIVKGGAIAGVPGNIAFGIVLQALRLCACSTVDEINGVK